MSRLTLWKWAYAAADVDPLYARELAFLKWLVRTGRVSEHP